MLFLVVGFVIRGASLGVAVRESRTDHIPDALQACQSAADCIPEPAACRKCACLAVQTNAPTAAFEGRIRGRNGPACTRTIPASRSRPTEPSSGARLSLRHIRRRV